MTDSRQSQVPFSLAYGDPTRIMGVLNATPDSFSGDGLLDTERLVQRGIEQVAAGAAILDVGGESTRPSAIPVDEADEAARVLPVIERLADRVQVPLSIDTMKPRVADRALALGVRVLNDVSGLRDPDLAQVAAAHDCWLVLLHTRWGAEPARDHLGGYYLSSDRAPENVVNEVAAGLTELVERARQAGVRDERIVVDPGLGFGKHPRESLELLRSSAELRKRLQPFPLLVGPSRKSFVGRALGLPADDRFEGTLACVVAATLAGAEIVRVHDVGPAVRAARMAWAIRCGHAARLDLPSASA